MSRARPGRARATAAAPSNLPPAGDNRAVPLRSCSFFCVLGGGSAPSGHPRPCGLARCLRLRHPAPTSAAMAVLVAVAAPPFLTHSSSSHFRVTAEKRHSDCQKAAECATATFSTPCVCFCAKQNNFGQKSHKIIEKNGKKFCSLGLLCLLLHQTAAKKRQTECVTTNRNGNNKASHIDRCHKMAHNQRIK